jgi:hypothetical protein
LQYHVEELDKEKLEEQARVLEQELILKERETLDVLKELEKTKGLVEDLKSKLRKEESEANLHLGMNVCDQRSIVDEKEMKEYGLSPSEVLQPTIPSHVSSPNLILMELKQAKLNLTKTTHDIADVRATVEFLNKKLENERISLEKTRERLTQNCSKVSSLEDELNQTRLRLQVVKGDPSDVTIELHRMSSEADRFRKMRDSAESEVLETMSEIELTKAMIKTAEIRLVAARKMNEASRAAEAATLADINALSNSNHDGSLGECMQKSEEITLSLEEFTTLIRKAQEAEEQSKNRVAEAMLEVDEANSSQMDILKRVEEAAEEVKTRKKALEEALQRVEDADRGKLEVEEALRKWRSDGHKRRSLTNSCMKFKNSGPSDHRRDIRLLDVNGLNLVNDEAKPVLKSSLSIGQILSQKLLAPEEFEEGIVQGERISVKRSESLGQMLGKDNDGPLFDKQVEKENGQKQFSTMRKKFGFARFSRLLSKQHKKKNNPMLNLR